MTEKKSREASYEEIRSAFKPFRDNPHLAFLIAETPLGLPFGEFHEELIDPCIRELMKKIK